MTVELHSKSAERQVLGAILNSDGAALPDIQASGLTGRDFYFSTHAQLYTLLINRQDENRSMERMAVYEAIVATQQAEEYGGIGYVSGLADDAPLLIDAHVERVQSLALLRRISQIGPWITAQACKPMHRRPSEHVEDVLELVEKAWNRVGSDRPDVGISADAGAQNLLAIVEKPLDATDYCPTGIGNLDHYIDGFGPGELIVLGGRSSMGKSVGAVCVTLNMAQQGHRVAFASLEMPSQEQHNRYISQVCGVPYRDMSPKGRHRLTPGNIQSIRSHASSYSQLPIHIKDSGVYTLRELRTYARRQQAQHRRTGAPLKGMVVDYIGLMVPDKGTKRTEATTLWITGLKKLAKELGIWILCLAQINRAAENLQDAIPRISNLADSTMMENTADIVILAYRPGYYDDNADPTHVEWIIGKQRGGERNVKAHLSWDPTTGRHFDRPAQRTVRGAGW